MAKKQIKIHFSQEDLEELMAGETFDWTFDGVDVHLYMGYDDNDGQDCIKCGLPIKIYMCKECENYGEEEAGECANCGREKNLDENYHKDCN
jgi:hypothetical protein